MTLWKPLFILFLIVNGSASLAAGDITYPQMEKEFERLGVTENYTSDSFFKLHEYISVKLATTGTDTLSKAGLLFFEHAERLMGKEQSAYTYFLAKRIVYTIVSEEHEGRKITIPEVLSIPKKVITKIPYKNIDTSAQITIRPDHFAWKRLEQLQVNPHTWESLEKWANLEVTKRLQAKYKKSEISYDLNKARTVFFLKKVKDNATSPKVNVVDAWNVKWKMKWGNEVRSEPVANRLYLNAGGKFQDLVYSYNYQDNVVLILSQANSGVSLESDLNCEENVSRLEVLKTCLSLPPYRFNLDPFIKSSGTITQENVDEILYKLVKSQINEYTKEALIGRKYVILKEASVEFRDDKIMERGGPIALSSVGADQDVFLRSNLLFNIWIDNYDNKDENAKSIILKNFEGEKEKYIEFFHDLGAAFGKEALPASLNAFEIGDSFLRTTLTKEHLLYTHFLLYRPKAWSAASATDLAWMANYLNGISVDQLKASVKASSWPSFAQEVFVYRLQKRLYQILSFYGYKSKEEVDAIAAPTIKISLKNSDDIVRFAKLHQVPLKLLISEMQRFGIYNNGYEDRVVIEGKLNTCAKSFVINFLEKHLYPSGIERRVNRRYDDRPLPECTFTK